MSTPTLHAVTAFLDRGHGQYALVAVVALVVVTVTAWRTVRALIRWVRQVGAGWQAENVLTVVAAGIATAVAMTGMWRFFGVTLHVSGPLRVLLFAFIEISVVTSAVRARRSMAEFGSAGVDGVAVWVLTSISAVLSAMDARSFAEVVFRLAAPMVAAWLWERGMAVARRRATGRRIHWRITPERILVRLGVAEGTDRATSDVDVHRRLSRLAQAAKHARSLQAAGARQWRQNRAHRRLDSAMSAAVEHAGLAADTGTQDALLGQLGALYNAGALIDLEPGAPWDRSPGPLQPSPAAVPAEPAPPQVSDTLGTAARVPATAPADGLAERVIEAAGAVPPGVPATAPDAVPEDVDRHLKRARRIFARDLAAGQVPSVRQLKNRLRVGQPRAAVVREHLTATVDH